MIQRESISLKLLLALVCLGGAQAKRLAFHFNAPGAYCSSSTFDVNVNLAKFLCDSGEDVCRPGDNVVVEGHMEVVNFLPIDVTQRVKVCKFGGALCTPVLDYSQGTLAEEWHIYSMYDNATYPDPGFYGFEHRFTWPDNTMTDYPWAGFNFNLVVDVHADDSSNDFTHLRCHAPFTVVDYDAYNEDGSTGSGFSTNFGRWGMLGIVGLGAYAGLMQRKRRLQETTPSINLGEEESQSCTNFEMMKSGATDGDTASVRV